MARTPTPLDMTRVVTALPHRDRLVQATTTRDSRAVTTTVSSHLLPKPRRLSRPFRLAPRLRSLTPLVTTGNPETPHSSTRRRAPTLTPVTTEEGSVEQMRRPTLQTGASILAPVTADPLLVSDSSVAVEIPV